jgi:hypothetical protein
MSEESTSENGEHSKRDEHTEALVADFEREIARVRVNLRKASPKMREFEPPIERENPDGSIDVTLTIDVSGIIETLRTLPNGAGTAAFVAAYNARPPRS